MVTSYNPETHEYFVDGERVPSVTEICEPISFKRLHELPPQVLERARQRGSRVHELCEEYLLVGELDEDEIETEYLPYIASFIEWVKTYRPKVLFTEHRLYFKDGNPEWSFAGTCDLICIIDNKVALIDYKTTSAVDKKSLSVQLAGYKTLTEVNNIEVDKTYYLHLKKNGYTFKEIEPNFGWLSILRQHNVFMRGK